MWTRVSAAGWTPARGSDEAWGAYSDGAPGPAGWPRRTCRPGWPSVPTRTWGISSRTWQPYPPPGSGRSRGAGPSPRAASVSRFARGVVGWSANLVPRPSAASAHPLVHEVHRKAIDLVVVRGKGERPVKRLVANGDHVRLPRCRSSLEGREGIYVSKARLLRGPRARSGEPARCTLSESAASHLKIPHHLQQLLRRCVMVRLIKTAVQVNANGFEHILSYLSPPGASGASSFCSRRARAFWCSRRTETRMASSGLRREA